MKKKVIVDYAKKLYDNKLSGEGGFIAYRIDESTAFLWEGDFDKANEEGIVTIDYSSEDSLAAKILKSKRGINVVLSISPKKVKLIAKARVDIPAMLDDMAQIVGRKVKVCKNDDNKVLKTIKKANSVIIEDLGAVVTARTLNEAFTCCMVLEKCAFVYVNSLALGGCKKIDYISAKLMQLFYRLKYSKKNQEIMMSEEK